MVDQKWKKFALLANMALLPRQMLFFGVLSIFAASCSSLSKPPSNDLLNLSHELTEQGRYAEAEETLRQTIETSNSQNDRHKAMKNLGNLWLNTNQFRKASSVYNEILIENPKNTEVLDELGISLIFQNDFDKAERLLQIGKNNGNKDTLLPLAVLFDLRLKHESAQIIYSEALGLHPKDLHIQNNFAFSLALADKCSDAINQVEMLKNRYNLSERQMNNLIMIVSLCERTTDAGRLGAFFELSQAEVTKSIKLGMELKKTNGLKRSNMLRKLLL